MSCAVGDQLRDKYAKATKSEGDYEESLRGTAGNYEHHEGRERLAGETAATRVAYLDHCSQCAECHS